MLKPANRVTGYIRDSISKYLELLRDSESSQDLLYNFLISMDPCIDIRAHSSNFYNDLKSYGSTDPGIRRNRQKLIQAFCALTYSTA